MDFQKEIISKITSDLESKRKKIFLDRLKELKIDVDFEAEKLRRFKSFYYQNDSYDQESIYYNDGSVDGLRVITFKRVDSFPTMDDFKTMNIRTEIKYY